MEKDYYQFRKNLNAKIILSCYKVVKFNKIRP